MASKAATLRNISKDIGNNDNLMDLGIQLNIDVAKIQEHQSINRREQNFSGTTKLLLEWGQGAKEDVWQSQLWRALENAGLIAIAEKHLKQGPSTSKKRKFAVESGASSSKAQEYITQSGSYITVTGDIIDSSVIGQQATIKGNRDVEETQKKRGQNQGYGKAEQRPKILHDQEDDEEEFDAENEDPKDPESLFRDRTITKPKYGQEGISLQRDIIYDLQNKGLALVLNNETCDGLDKRTWSRKDEVHMKELFERLGYKLPYTLKECRDLKKAEMTQKIWDFKSELNKSKAHSAVVYIGSHGGKRGVRAKDRGKYLSVNDIMKEFNNVLPGKPKVIIIDACWGGDPTVPNEDVPNDDSGNGAPENADIFVIHATSEGKTAWSNLSKGSWFVQALCTVCYDEERELEDLDTIMLRVTEELKKRRAVSKESTQCTTLIKQGVSKRLFFY